MDESSGSRRFEVNVRAVWGQMATGGGSSHLNECMGTMGIPGLKTSSFSDIEEDIRVWWEKALHKEMLENGREERKLAIERGDMHEGIPAVTVVVDGGWSKRTHRHSYNALGGVAVVIGAATKKLLHIGVRCKYCAVCVKADTRGEMAPEHQCFQNWKNSSQSMEADIILEAFQVCEERHGIRYLKLVGDGDSSVYATLVSRGPYWCRDLQKLECANHACKCLRSNLEKLVAENPSFKGKNGLSKKKRVHMVSYIRYAITQRSRGRNIAESASKLSSDIHNTLWHVFGEHKHCDADICRGKVQKDWKGQHGKSATHATDGNPSEVKNPVPCHAHEEEEEEEEEEDACDVIESQVKYWKEGSSPAEQEAARGEKSDTATFIPAKIVAEVSRLLDKLSSKSYSLISNSTTNLCESWMSIRAKFDGGKQIFRCQESSWYGRCYGAGLRSILGPTWSLKVWQDVSGKPPDEPFNTIFHKKSRMLTTSYTCKAKEEVRRRARKRKRARNMEAESKKAKLAYGCDSLQVEDDVTKSSLEEECTLYYSRNVKVTPEASSVIERTSKEQSFSGVWHAERKHRLTSSNFKDIVKRRTKTSSVPLVSRLLYSTFRGNKYTQYGLAQEESTIADYKTFKADNGCPVSVDVSGLIIHPQHPFLACSPDGVVTELNSGSVGLVEVKNVLLGKNLTLSEAVDQVKSFCLEREGSALHLKKNHAYYMQCQGQLAVADKPWVDFVVRARNPPDLHVERIYKDSCLWDTLMLPKLQTFFFEALLPELAVPRSGKQPGIREVQPGLNGHLYVSVQSDFERGPSTSGIQSTSRPEVETGGHPSAIPHVALSRPRRQHIKFLGRRIRHRWIDAETNESCWYNGSVKALLRGRDGFRNAVYEVHYDDEDEAYEVDHLREDYDEGSLEILIN